MTSFIKKITVVFAFAALPAVMVPAVASNAMTGWKMSNGALVPVYGEFKTPAKSDKGFKITKISGQKVGDVDIASADNIVTVGLKTKSIIGWEMDDGDLIPVYGDIKGRVNTKNILSKKMDDNTLTPVYGDSSRPTKTKKIIGWEMDDNDLVPIYQ